MKLWMIFL